MTACIVLATLTPQTKAMAMDDDVETRSEGSDIIDEDFGSQSTCHTCLVVNGVQFGARFAARTYISKHNYLAPLEANVML